MANFGHHKTLIAGWKAECNEFLASREQEGYAETYYSVMCYRQMVCENIILRSEDAITRDESKDLLILLRLCMQQITKILENKTILDDSIIIL